MPSSTLVSRADLLTCMRAHGAEHIAAWAQALGYIPQDAQSRRVLLSAVSMSVPDGAPLPPQALPTPAELPQWRAHRVIDYQVLTQEAGQQDAPEWYREAVPWQEEDQALSANPHARPPAQLPLMPWARLWPLLKAVLSVRLESAQLDVPPLVERLARGEIPQRLPRRMAQRWAGTCQVLIDFAEALMPFWDDFHGLQQRLLPLRGVQGIAVLAFPEGDPEGPCLAWSPAQHHWQECRGYTLPTAGTPVLVLSDLGCTDVTGARRRPWQRLGQSLRRTGCQPVALMPCPPWAWSGEVTQLFAPVYWDRAARRPRRPRPVPGRSVACTSQDWEAAALPLLRALGAAVRIEPALLRAVRYALPGRDVGSEAAAWNHPHLHATPLAAYYEPEEVAAYRQGFAQLDLSLRQEIARLLAVYHAHLSPVIGFEEQWLRATSDSVPPSQECATFLARLVRSLCEQEGNFVAATRAWVERMARRQDVVSWHAERLVAVWVAAHLPQLQAKELLAVPRGLDIDKARWLLTGDSAPKHYTLRQRGDALFIETEAPAHPLDAAGSPLGRLHTARPFVQVQYLDGHAPEFLHPVHQGLALPAAGGVRLRTEHQKVRIESQPRPAWASGLGQDRHGVFVRWAAGQRQAYWVPPGIYPVTNRAGKVLEPRDIRHGFWCDAAEALELLQEGFRQPLWAEAYGVDKYGLYADWSVRGVTQRMRWMAPGVFGMGSPEGEQDRSSNEVLHTVRLTRSFWLADTACTQELWQAVPGSTPVCSRQDKDHPVNNVSWNDVQTFLQRLNAMAPSGALRLPTEAEWEYACRAGTTTAFSFGEQITKEQVPYLRISEGTVPVKARPCNAWGLYQMHGNVWEWCQDWYAPYPASTADTAADLSADATDIAAVDPVGAVEGVDRVLRGGSWFDVGRFARSARRLALRPAQRSALCGFRLARGQVSTEGRAPEAQSGL